MKILLDRRGLDIKLLNVHNQTKLKGLKMLVELDSHVHSFNIHSPLASQLRPSSLDDFVGQSHLVAPGKLFRRLIESDSPSLGFSTMKVW